MFCNPSQIKKSSLLRQSVAIFLSRLFALQLWKLADMSAFTSITPQSSSSLCHSFSSTRLVQNPYSANEFNCCYSTPIALRSLSRRNSQRFEPFRVRSAATKPAKSPGICYISLNQELYQENKFTKHTRVIFFWYRRD